jgi:hypothetical protein
MTQNISINTRMAGIPPGCNRYGRMVRGCRRVAPQPPANGWNPSGMHPPQTGGLPAVSRGSSEATPPDMTPRRFPQTGGLPAVSRWSRRAAPTPPDLTPRRFPQTGGLPAISRGSSEATPPDLTPRRFPQTGGLPAVSRGSSEATPPDMEMKTYCIPEGCQPTRGDARFANATQMLRSLRDRFHRGASWSGGVGALRLNPRLMAGIPPGCNRYARMVRGCRRVAPQPPANGGHPSGMHPPQTGGLPAVSRGSSEATPPDMTPRRFPQTGGLPAISRGSSEATPPDLTPREFPQTGGLPAVSRGSSEATPPDMEMKTNCIPEGCQPTCGDARFANATKMESGK